MVVSQKYLDTSFSQTYNSSNHRIHLKNNAPRRKNLRASSHSSGRPHQTGAFRLAGANMANAAFARPRRLRSPLNSDRYAGQNR